MKEFKANLKILKVEKLNNSIYGNPCRRLITEREDGEILVGKTATNAILGYEVSWTWEGEWKVLAYHFTKSGNCIFDRLTNLEAKQYDKINRTRKRKGNCLRMLSSKEL